MLTPPLPAIGHIGNRYLIAAGAGRTRRVMVYSPKHVDCVSADAAVRCERAAKLARRSTRERPRFQTFVAFHDSVAEPIPNARRHLARTIEMSSAEGVYAFIKENRVSATLRAVTSTVHSFPNAFPAWRLNTVCAGL